MAHKINITSMLEHLFAVSEINTEQDLQLLIDTFDEMEDKVLADPKTLADVAERIQQKREKNK